MKKSYFKKAVSLLCAIAILLSISVTAGAAERRNEENVFAKDQVTPVSDTLELSPEDYISMHKAFSRGENAVQATCELFVASIFASRRNEAYNCEAFVSNPDELDPTLAYIQSVNAYQREIAPMANLEILSDSISFENFSAKMNGNHCDAEIQMHYSYELTGAFDNTCYLNCMYYITLVKRSDGWFVESAKTSMPDEESDGFTYEAFDAHAAAVAAMEDHDFSEVEKEHRGIRSNMGVRSIMTYQTTAYSTSNAISYAASHYNSINSLFGGNLNTSGNNCQNFASQCVWAGLLSGCGASGTSTTARPAVPTSFVGSNAPNVWCRNQYTTYYSHYTNNWAWDNVNGFIRLIWASDHTQSGPQGYYWFGLAKACAGDVITWDTDGTRDVANGTYDHAMFVTQVTGTYGSRGVSNMFIAANSKPTTSAYLPLVQYCSYSANKFATSHITGGYYNI